MMCIKYATLLLPICIFEQFDTIAGDINNQTFWMFFENILLQWTKIPFL